MNSPLNKIQRISARDLVYLGTVIVAVSVSYTGISKQVEHLTEKVEVIDERLWQLQGRGQQALSAIPCPADATFVAMRP